MNEMVERVARALAEPIPDHPDFDALAKATQNYWRDKARTAIEAMREPTEGMIAAGDDCDTKLDEFTATPLYAAECEVHWQAMIDAALGSEKQP